eukprot:SAG31_NODE_2032_length_6625_cov_3.010113_5_plen_561_part_00
MAALLEQNFLEEGEVQRLCQQAIELLQREENVRNVPAPCTVVGDIHGQLHDFIEILKIGGQPPDTNFVFMGDFVDRGYYSVECVSLVLTFKVRWPDYYLHAFWLLLFSLSFSLLFVSLFFTIILVPLLPAAPRGSAFAAPNSATARLRWSPLLLGCGARCSPRAIALPVAALKLWSNAIGNELAIEPALFEDLAAVQRSGAQYEEKAKRAAMMATDLERTFPDLGSMFSSETSPYSSGLTRILQAYARFRPELGDIGYVQGMSYLAAMLLMHGDVDGMCQVRAVTFSFLCPLLEKYGTFIAICNALIEKVSPCMQNVAPAFVSLANLIESTVLLPLFRMEPATADRYFAFFVKSLRSELPHLAAHLDQLGVEPSAYLLDWTFTLFCKSLPAEVALWVWDRVIIHPEGDAYVFKTALGLLQFMEPMLLACTDIAECIGQLRDVRSLLNTVMSLETAGLERLFVVIDNVRLSSRQWLAFRKSLLCSTESDDGWRSKAAAVQKVAERGAAELRDKTQLAAKVAERGATELRDKTERMLAPSPAPSTVLVSALPNSHGAVTASV